MITHNAKYAVKWVLLAASFCLISVLVVNKQHNHPFSSYPHVGQTAGRAIDRNMNFYEGYEKTPVWERFAHGVLFGSRSDVVDEAVANIESVFEYFREHPESAKPWVVLNLKARLLVILAENNRWQKFDRITADPSPPLEEEVMIGAVRFAYGRETQDLDPGEIRYGARLLPLGWASRILHMRLAQRWNRNRDYLINVMLLHQSAERIRADLRLVLLVVATWLCAAMIAAWYFRKLFFARSPPLWDNRCFEKPWPAFDGLLHFAFWLLAAIVVYTVLESTVYSLTGSHLVSLWSSLGIYGLLLLPIFYLLRKYRVGFTDVFGLHMRAVSWGRLSAVVVVYAAALWGGSMAISYLAWLSGARVSWVQSLNESIVFGSAYTASMTAVDTIVWAPVCEEIVFRGLFYLTLRQWMKPWYAIFVCATVFSLLHFGSLLGFVTVFWAGVVLTYCFERYRSLIPGMLVHAASNVVPVITVWLFYS